MHCHSTGGSLGVGWLGVGEMVLGRVRQGRDRNWGATCDVGTADPALAPPLGHWAQSSAQNSEPADGDEPPPT